MPKIYKCCLILIFGFFFMQTFAQNKEVGLQIFGGTSLALGDFAKKIGSPVEITRRAGFVYGENIGLATTGFTFGAELTVPVLIEGLGWQISTKLILNPTNKDEIENQFNNDPKAAKSLTFETGSWVNLPLFSGFSYGISLSNELNLFGHLQAGINFTQQAPRQVTYDGTIVEDTKYRIVPDFGFEFGLSIECYSKYLLNFRYLNLNRPRYEGTRYLNEKMFPEIPRRDFNIDAEEKPVTLLLVTFGYKI